MKTWKIETASEKATFKLAEKVGKKLRGSEVIELVSDLGGGKTVFVRGLAKGAGSDDRVTSPTFTLSNVYEAGKLHIYHFDFYRLDQPGIMSDELVELLGEPDSVVIVEWADIVDEVLPPEHLTIRLAALGEEKRRLEFIFPDHLRYLLPEED